MKIFILIIAVIIQFANVAHPAAPANHVDTTQPYNSVTITAAIDCTSVPSTSFKVDLYVLDWTTLTHDLICSTDVTEALGIRSYQFDLNREVTDQLTLKLVVTGPPADLQNHAVYFPTVGLASDLPARSMYIPPKALLDSLFPSLSANDYSQVIEDRFNITPAKAMSNSNYIYNATNFTGSNYERLTTIFAADLLATEINSNINETHRQVLPTVIDGTYLYSDLPHSIQDLLENKFNIPILGSTVTATNSQNDVVDALNSLMDPTFDANGDLVVDNADVDLLIADINSSFANLDTEAEIKAELAVFYGKDLFDPLNAATVASDVMQFLGGFGLGWDFATLQAHVVMRAFYISVYTTVDITPYLQISGKTLTAAEEAAAAAQTILSKAAIQILNPAFDFVAFDTHLTNFGDDYDTSIGTNNLFLESQYRLNSNFQAAMYVAIQHFLTAVPYNNPGTSDGPFWDFVYGVNPVWDATTSTAFQTQFSVYFTPGDPLSLIW